MIGYVTLGTNDLPRAAAFYDALLAEIGAKRLMDFGRGYAWGSAMDKTGTDPLELIEQCLASFPGWTSRPWAS